MSCLTTATQVVRWQRRPTRGDPSMPIDTERLKVLKQSWDTVRSGRRKLALRLQLDQLAERKQPGAHDVGSHERLDQLVGHRTRVAWTHRGHRNPPLHRRRQVAL